MTPRERVSQIFADEAVRFLREVFVADGIPLERADVRASLETLRAEQIAAATLIPDVGIATLASLSDDALRRGWRAAFSADALAALAPSRPS